MAGRPAYFSQWGDVTCNDALILDGVDPVERYDWERDGYPTPDLYSYWSERTCGIACLQSILADRERDAPDKYALIEAALRWRAFVRHDDGSLGGLYYQPFCEWVGSSFGLDAHVHRHLEVDGLVDLVTHGHSFVMASVSSEIRWPDRAPTRKGGHLVLVYGYESGELVFHNPSGVTGTAAAARLGRREFEEFYAGRGISVERAR